MKKPKLTSDQTPPESPKTYHNLPTGEDAPLDEWGFSLYISFRGGEIIDIENAGKWLLCNEKKFATMKNFNKRIHPQDVIRVLIDDKSLQKLIYKDAAVRRQLPKSVYVNDFRIKRGDGEYLEVCRLSTACIFDTEGFPSYVWHKYIVLGRASNDYRARGALFRRGALPLTEHEVKFKELVKAYNINNLHKLFTRTQLDILQYVLEGYTTKEIAIATGRKVNTINTHRTDIIERGTKNISESLNSVPKIAMYLQKLELL